MPAANDVIAPIDAEREIPDLRAGQQVMDRGVPAVIGDVAADERLAV
jgi:hypothetical protein